LISRLPYFTKKQNATGITRTVSDAQRSAEFYSWLLGLDARPAGDGFRLACANGELVLRPGPGDPVAIGLARAARASGPDPDGVAVRAAPAAARAGGTVTALDHVSLVCADLVRTVGFYRALGFVPTWSGTPPDYEDSVRGFHDVLPPGTDWLHLSGADGYLALSQADWLDYGTHTANAGPPRFVHAGFNVPDLAPIASRLDAAGIRYLRSSPDPVGTRLYLNDPDGDARLGNNIELEQYNAGVARSGKPPY
jgi:catechol 2,3-dioxygenase-like lactoylglutathione lyase family enzyme